LLFVTNCATHPQDALFLWNVKFVHYSSNFASVVLLWELDVARCCEGCPVWFLCVCGQQACHTWCFHLKQFVWWSLGLWQQCRGGRGRWTWPCNSDLFFWSPCLQNLIILLLVKHLWAWQTEHFELGTIAMSSER